MKTITPEQGKMGHFANGKATSLDGNCDQMPRQLYLAERRWSMLVFANKMVFNSDGDVDFMPYA